MGSIVYPRKEKESDERCKLYVEMQWLKEVLEGWHMLVRKIEWSLQDMRGSKIIDIMDVMK
jgi:hypothetical protein